MTNVDIKGYQENKMGFVGALAGVLAGIGKISECAAEGVVAGSCFVGGLVGAVIGEKSMVTKCTSGVNVSGDKESMDITNRAGGLVGFLVGTIQDSTASGSVTGAYSAGGLVGICQEGATIINSTASGNVVDNRYSGELVGEQL